MHEVKHEQSDALKIALREAMPTMADSVVDSIIRPFSPQTLQRRLTARRELALERMQLAYDAAIPTLDRTMAWGPLRSEEAELPGFQRYQLMLEGRDLFRNSPIIRAAINGIARRSVGNGLRLRVFTDDRKWNRMAMQQWDSWSKTCEISGLDLTAICRTAIRAANIDGDIGIGLLDSNNDLALQAVEADLIGEEQRVGINIDRSNPIGGVIINNQTLAPEAYMVGRRDAGGQLVECSPWPAESFICMFRRQRVSQVRGVALIAPVIQVARDLERYIYSTRMQANAAASFNVFIKRAMPGRVQQAMTRNGNTVAAPDGTSYNTMAMPTGRIMFLNPDEDVEFPSSKTPSPEFDSFARFLVRLIAIGIDYTYESLMQDFSGMSFSSSKTNLLAVRQIMREWRQWLVDQFLYRTWCVWVAKRMTSGQLPFNDQAYDHLKFRGPEEVGIDPESDATNDIAMLQAGTKTMDDVYAPRGEDWREKLEQRLYEVKYIRERCEQEGVPVEQVTNVMTPGSAPLNQEKPEPTAKKDKKVPVGVVDSNDDNED